MERVLSNSLSFAVKCSNSGSESLTTSPPMTPRTTPSFPLRPSLLPPSSSSPLGRLPATAPRPSAPAAAPPACSRRWRLIRWRRPHVHMASRTAFTTGARNDGAPPPRMRRKDIESDDDEDARPVSVNSPSSRLPVRLFRPRRSTSGVPVALEEEEAAGEEGDDDDDAEEEPPPSIPPTPPAPSPPPMCVTNSSPS